MDILRGGEYAVIIIFLHFSLLAPNLSHIVFPGTILTFEALGGKIFVAKKIHSRMFLLFFSNCTKLGNIDNLRKTIES